jgi:hypothetical protein
MVVATKCECHFIFYTFWMLILFLFSIKSSRKGTAWPLSILHYLYNYKFMEAFEQPVSQTDGGSEGSIVL